MDYLSIKKKLDNNAKDTDIVDLVILSEKFFYVNEIVLFPSTEKTIAEITKMVYKDLPIKINYIKDERCLDSIILISCGTFFVNYFSEFIKKLTNNTMLSIDEQKKLALEAMYHLDKYSKAHNVSNRFSFASKPILKLECKDGKIAIDYNSVLLDNEQTNLLRELFTVRQEIFSELLNLTESYLYKLEYNSYRNSKIKMDDEKGKYLLYEFIIGISFNNELIDVEKEQLEQLTTNLFRLFGLKPPKASYLSEKIYNRVNPASGLMALAKNIQDAAKQKKRIGKK